MWYQYEITLAKIHKIGQVPSRITSVRKSTWALLDIQQYAFE